MPPVVDVHSHIYPDWYLNLFRDRDRVPRLIEEGEARRLHLAENRLGAGFGPVMDADFTSFEAKLAFMDEAGIDVSIVSLGNPWLDGFDPALTVGLALEANARLADAAAATGGRVFGMGILPVAPPPEAAEVVEQVAGAEALRGVITSPRLAGHLLDDPELEPVWTALAAHRIPLMVHPSVPVVPDEMDGYGMGIATGVGFPSATTVAVARLLMSDVLDRHPDLIVVVPHGGGALPFLRSRLEVLQPVPEIRERVARNVGRLVLDSVVYADGPLRLAVETVGPERVLFGTDHPFPTDVERIRGAIEAAVSREDREWVLGGGAVEWYRLPAATEPAP